ncbi:CYCLINS [Salix purpurea]|uniref:B-like cyclin n=1 Tax=Salix purpurea TaxID=77065 RepID=A0A9Q0V1K2_SALPP|nr:CYCLINS [Salix purpurea]
MGDFDSSLSLSSLLCHENETCFFDDSRSWWSGRPLLLDTDVARLLTIALITSHNWLKFARLDAIEWILNTRAIHGFRFHTAYLSVTYFDRFVSKRSIDEGKLWAVRLLSVACLSLAAKMEERKAPPLSEFPVEDYCFGNKVIQRMELLVLNTLDWRMNSITPFAYLHYFIRKTCGESTPKETVSRAVELIVAMIKEIDLLDHRPSVIAAAAVLAASNRQFTREELELKMDTISSWGSLENENVFSCYIAMQEIEMGKVKTPRLVFYPSPSSIHSGSFDVLENSSIVSGAGIKRSLAFNECDQTCPAKKTRRP